MPVGFIVSGRNLEVLLMGKFTPREAEEAVASGLKCGRMEPMRLLVEMQQPAFLPTLENVRFASDMLVTHRSRIATRCAFVVPDDAYFEAVNEAGRHVAPPGFEVGTFRDVETAKTWLDQMEPGP
jgi:hypothetical protein